jgi:hypothetical protein
MIEAAVKQVVFYTRRRCCLCDTALAVVLATRREVDFALQVIDIDGDASLVARYGDKIPVVVVDGRMHAKYRVDAQAFRRRLSTPAREVTS